MPQKTFVALSYLFESRCHRFLVVGVSIVVEDAGQRGTDVDRHPCSSTAQLKSARRASLVIMQR